MEISKRELTREFESPAKIPKLDHPLPLPGDSHGDHDESSSGLLAVEVTSERSDCELADNHVLNSTDGRDIRSLADIENHIPKEGNEENSVTDAKAVHSYDTILNYIPAKERDSSVEEAADIFQDFIETILPLYASYRLGDRKHPGDAIGDNGCECDCHETPRCCCNHCYWDNEYEPPDNCLPGREYCQDCREDHDDEDPHTFEDVRAELEDMIITVKEYMKEQKSLAALLLLEAVFIVAVTEPVGPKEYTGHRGDEYGDGSQEFMKAFFRWSTSLLMEIFLQPEIRCVQKTVVKRVSNAMICSPHDGRQFAAFNHVKSWQDPCSVACVKSWQDPLLCQVISGQQFQDALVEAKAIVRRRLETLEAEERFLEALNYIDGVTIDLTDCPVDMPEHNRYLLDRGAAYLFRLNRYADGLWRLFYGHTGDHLYGARKGRNVAISKFVTVLKAVCGAVVEEECLPRWAWCLKKWKKREKHSLLAASKTVCLFVSYACHVGLIPKSLEILTGMIELTAMKRLRIPTEEADLKKFRSHAMKIVERSASGFDTDLEFASSDWSSKAMQLQFLSVLLCKLFGSKELDNCNTPEAVDEMLDAFKENVWAVIYIANSPQLVEQPSEAVVSSLCDTFFPKYGMVDITPEAIESWYKLLPNQTLYAVTKNLLQQAFKGQPSVAEDPIPSHLDKKNVLARAEVLLQAAIAPEPLRHDKDFLAFIQYLYKEIFQQVEVETTVSFVLLLVKKLRQFYGQEEWAAEEASLISIIINNAHQNTPALAETFASTGQWPYLLRLLNKVGFGYNSYGRAVIEKLKDVAEKMSVVQQHAPFLQAVEVWLKERSSVDHKPEINPNTGPLRKKGFMRSRQTESTDPLLCQILSGQQFDETLVEAKAVVQHRLDVLEAEDRFVEALNYIDSVTIDLADCPDATPEDTCELQDRGAAYLFRLNRYADGFWRLFYGHNGDHLYGARKGDFKFVTVLKVVCGKGDQQPGKERNKEKVDIPVKEEIIKTFQDHAVKIVDQSTARLDTDLQFTPPGWSTKALQLVEPLLCARGKVFGDHLCSVLSHVSQIIQKHYSSTTFHDCERYAVLNWLKSAQRILCYCNKGDHFILMRSSVLQGPRKKKPAFMRLLRNDPIIMATVDTGARSQP